MDTRPGSSSGAGGFGRIGQDSQAATRGLTVDFTVHLLEPAQGERVVAQGRVVRGGRYRVTLRRT